MELGITVTTHVWTQKLTNFINYCPSWEAKLFLAVRRNFPSILWDPIIHYRVKKRLLLVSVLSQINPVHNPTSSCTIRSILILFSYLRLSYMWCLHVLRQNILWAACYVPRPSLPSCSIIPVIVASYNAIVSIRMLLSPSRSKYPPQNSDLEQRQSTGILLP